MLRGGRAVTTREARSPSLLSSQRGSHYLNQAPSVAQEEEEEEEEEEETTKQPPHIAARRGAAMVVPECTIGVDSETICSVLLFRVPTFFWGDPTLSPKG